MLMYGIWRVMSASGHSLPTHPGPKSTDVRYCPDSDHITEMAALRRSVKPGPSAKGFDRDAHAYMAIALRHYRRFLNARRPVGRARASASSAGRR